MAGFRLDLGAVSEDLLASWRRPLDDHGVDVRALSARRAVQRDWLEQLHGLLLSVGADWPDPDPAGPWVPPLPLLREWLSRGEHAEAFFVATKGSQWIGFSSRPVLGTAMHPAWRGRGIATALQALTSSTPAPRA